MAQYVCQVKKKKKICAFSILLIIIVLDCFVFNE